MAKFTPASIGGSAGPWIGIANTFIPDSIRVSYRTLEAVMSTVTASGGAPDPGPEVDAGTFRYYRLRIFQNNGAAANVSLTEAHAYETASGTDVLDGVGVTLTASSTGSGLVTNLTDGDTTATSHWTADLATNGPIDIDIDLGSGNDKDLIEWEFWNKSTATDEAPGRIFIYHSSDNITWTLRAVFSNLWPSSPQKVSMAGRSATQFQFYRFGFLGNNGGTNFRLDELEIHATAGGADQIPSGTKKCKSTQAVVGTDDEDHLFDDNTASAYVVAASNLPTWVYLDIDAVVDFQALALGEFTKKGGPTTNESPDEVVVYGLGSSGQWMKLAHQTGLTWSANETKTFPGAVPTEDFLTSMSWARLKQGAAQSVPNNTNDQLDTMWTTSEAGGILSFAPNTTTGEFTVPEGCEQIEIAFRVYGNVNVNTNPRMYVTLDGTLAQGYYAVATESNHRQMEVVVHLNVYAGQKVALWTYQASGVAANYGEAGDFFEVRDVTGRWA